MDEKQTHEIMNELVETVDELSLLAFGSTGGDTLVTGVVASKEHGQMLILGPLDQRNALGMMLTVIAGAGELIECFDDEEIKTLYELASKTLEVSENPIIN